MQVATEQRNTGKAEGEVVDIVHCPLQLELHIHTDIYCNKTSFWIAISRFLEEIQCFSLDSLEHVQIKCDLHLRFSAPNYPFIEV